MRRISFIAALACWCASLAGCSASIPEGIYSCSNDEDCPSGFECRQDEDDALYCFRAGGATAGSEPQAGRGGRGGSGGTGGAAGSRSGAGAPGAGGSGAAGDAGMPMAGADAGPPMPVTPSATGFTTLGGVRSGGGLRLYDERFERGARLCSSDGKLCVTGGFEP